MSMNDITLKAIENLRNTMERAMIDDFMSVIPSSDAEKDVLLGLIDAFQKRGVSPMTTMSAFMEAFGGVKNVDH